MDISVIIPVYDAETLVAETLESVLAQTCRDWELVLVDDGSTDGTRAILAEYARRDPRVRVVRQANAGIAAARNRGIAEARGDFIALLDQDDLWPAERLEWQGAALRAQPDAVLVYGAMSTFGAGESYTYPGEDAPSGRVFAEFARYNHIRSPGQTLIRASALRQAGGFDERIWGADDWDLYLRLARVGAFVYVPHCALRYRVHAANASRDIGRMYLNALRVHRKNLGALPAPGRARLWLASLAFVKHMASEEWVARAQAYERESRGAEARACWLAAARVKPWMLRHGAYRARVMAALLGRREATRPAPLAAVSGAAKGEEP